MATEGPFEVDADTGGLFLLNGANAAAAGNNEATTSSFGDMVEAGSATAGSGILYDQTGYADSAGLDANDKGTLNSSAQHGKYLIKTGVADNLLFDGSDGITMIHVGLYTSVQGADGDRFACPVSIGNADSTNNRILFYLTDNSNNRVNFQLGHKTGTISVQVNNISGIDVLNEWLMWIMTVEFGSGTAKYDFEWGRLTGASKDSNLNSAGSVSSQTLVKPDGQADNWNVQVNNYVAPSLTRQPRGTISTALFKRGYMASADREQLFDDALTWTAGGTVPAMFHHYDKNMQKDDKCGLLEPTFQDIINYGQFGRY